ncbi:ATP-dependent DNA/RNA helicase [Quaeritorhiza haematococci]|nr:ATP-dependent DNA/RNA helicase [Quaeritorhiza haematococci]
MHRVGRTARGVGNDGWALSFVCNEEEAGKTNGKKGKEGWEWVSGKDAEIFGRIKKSQKEIGREITPFIFDMSQVEGFRYRCEDAMRAVTKVSIRSARLKEVKAEIMNSEKLKAHFEDNPKDLEALRHDKPVHVTKTQAHLKHVPSYLLPSKRKVGASIYAANSNGGVNTGDNDESRKRERGADGDGEGDGRSSSSGVEIGDLLGEKKGRHNNKRRKMTGTKVGTGFSKGKVRFFPFFVMIFVTIGTDIPSVFILSFDSETRAGSAEDIFLLSMKIVEKMRTLRRDYGK